MRLQRLLAHVCFCWGRTAVNYSSCDEVSLCITWNGMMMRMISRIVNDKQLSLCASICCHHSHHFLCPHTMLCSFAVVQRFELGRVPAFSGWAARDAGLAGPGKQPHLLFYAWCRLRAHATSGSMLDTLTWRPRLQHSSQCKKNIIHAGLLFFATIVFSLLFCAFYHLYTVAFTSSNGI